VLLHRGRAGAQVFPVGKVGLGLGVNQQHPGDRRQCMRQTIYSLDSVLVLSCETHVAGRYFLVVERLVWVRDKVLPQVEELSILESCSRVREIWSARSIGGLTDTCVFSPLRCLTVYPWTQRYFGKFGNLFNAAAIASNPKVKAHGKVIMGALEMAAKNLDDIKNAYTQLSILHSEKLQVDPDNFKLLADCVTIVVAGQLGKAFTPEVHAAFEKFLAVVVASLRKQYY
uniref:Globin domain-containing protein n=2 Tax=Nothobranchius TaxID=28779 RepID=A0A8C6L5C0_NOTFU